MRKAPFLNTSEPITHTNHFHLHNDHDPEVLPHHQKDLTPAQRLEAEQKYRQELAQHDETAERNHWSPGQRA